MSLNKSRSLVASSLVTSREVNLCLTREALRNRKASKMLGTDKQALEATHTQLSSLSSGHFLPQAARSLVSLPFSNGARLGGSEEHLLASGQQKIPAS